LLFCPACITKLGEINWGPASMWDDTALYCYYNRNKS
jgi:hypothetical protein